MISNRGPTLSSFPPSCISNGVLRRNTNGVFPPARTYTSSSRSVFVGHKPMRLVPQINRRERVAVMMDLSMAGMRFAFFLTSSSASSPYFKRRYFRAWTSNSFQGASLRTLKVPSNISALSTEGLGTPPVDRLPWRLLGDLSQA
jgi:hypothetical protein